MLQQYQVLIYKKVLPLRLLKKVNHHNVTYVNFEAVTNHVIIIEKMTLQINLSKENTENYECDIISLLYGYL